MNVLNFGDISPDFKSEWIKTILTYNNKKKKISSWSNLLLTKKNNNLLVNSYFNKKDKIVAEIDREKLEKKFPKKKIN